MGWFFKSYEQLCHFIWIIIFHIQTRNIYACYPWFYHIIWAIKTVNLVLIPSLAPHHWYTYLPPVTCDFITWHRQWYIAWNRLRNIPICRELPVILSLGTGGKFIVFHQDQAINLPPVQSDKITGNSWWYLVFTLWCIIHPTKNATHKTSCTLVVLSCNAWTDNTEIFRKCAGSLTAHLLELWAWFFNVLLRYCPKVSC